jgi:ribosomal protein S18 acetylase RimI-like enzyme
MAFLRVVRKNLRVDVLRVSDPTRSSMSAVAANPTLKFREAVPADVRAIVALVESAYRGDASRAGWTTEADLLDGQRVDVVSVAEIVIKRGSSVLLAEIDGVLVACCHLEKQGQACYFGMFSVKPTQQGSGVGKLMIVEAERIAREEWKCTKMEMTVISVRDELIAWYERRGYRRSGLFKPFPYGDARFGIPKRDDLRFELMVKPLDARGRT